jgi:hypothetical protein
LIPFFCCNSFIIQVGWFSKKKGWAYYIIKDQ